MTIWDKMKNNDDESFNKTDDDTTSVEQESVETIGTTTTTLFGRQGQEDQSNEDNKDMIRVVKSSSSSTATLSTSNQIPESNISNNDEEEAQQQTSLSILERCCCCNNSMIMRKRLSIALLLSFAIIILIITIVALLIIVLLFFTVVFQTNEENNNELSSSSSRRKPTTTPEYLEMKKILKSYIPDIPSNTIQDETLLWLSTNNNDNGLVLQATQQSIPDQRLLERFVLALLYKSLVVVDGDDNNNWVFNDPDSLWLSNKSVCDWEKVTCDQNNDNLVGSIDLSRNYFLTGEIPTELGLLTSLTRLYIMNANNGLSGTIPKSEVGIH